MRGDMHAFLRTLPLTPEAITILNNSITLATKMCHNETTSLHVVAVLMTSPSGFFREACIRSHNNSSNVSPCRALEVCFRVALGRLRTAQRIPGSGGPPFSRSLMAAVRRVVKRPNPFARQRQPLVDVEHLAVSILTDPAVGRVMLEASVSSLDVKAVVQQTLDSRPGTDSTHLDGLVGGEDDVGRVLDVLSLWERRNPVLVVGYEAKEVVQEALYKIALDEIRDRVFTGVEVISVKEGHLITEVKELREFIERKIVVNGKEGSGLIVNLGDLRCLVDQPCNKEVSEALQEAVTELGLIIRKFREGSKIRFIAAATCQTYSRCQVDHPTMESEWELQLVSITARPPMPGMMPSPRPRSINGNLNTSNECLSPLKGFTMHAPLLTSRESENINPLRRVSFCPHCAENYEEELAKLEVEQVDIQLEEVKSDGTRSWLQNAKMYTHDEIKRAAVSAKSKEQDMILRQTTQELQKNWSQTCSQLHPNFHHNVSSERIIPSCFSTGGFNNLNFLSHRTFEPNFMPGSPVRTDPMKLSEAIREKVHKDCLEDFHGCISSETQSKIDEMPRTERPGIPGEVDSFRRLLEGLTEKVGWQTEAASSIASTITRCKLARSKGYIWLLFLGPDRVGKKKMAVALSELECGVSLIVISLGSRRDYDESGLTSRGRTVVDRIADFVRKNPFSVILLQDIDEADLLVRKSIKLAMERGRLTDSHGQEISLGNVIFVLTSLWTPCQLTGDRLSCGGLTLNEEKLVSIANGGWQLRISIGKKATSRRSPSWFNDYQERTTKQRKDSGQGQVFLFDLNQLAYSDEDRSHNSSDLTVEHEEHAQEIWGSRSLTTSSCALNELLCCVDEAIVFKPVDFVAIQHNIERLILSNFSAIVGDNLPVKIESEALEKILSGVWFGQTPFESWVEEVLVPTIQTLKTTLASFAAHSPDCKMRALLELDQESENQDFGEWLPSRISVVTDAQ